MTVEEVSKEVYQDLRESGYLSESRVQNLIWIHEFFEEFGDWPTTGELQDWINEEATATIVKEGWAHEDVGPNQIRPRWNELRDDHGVIERLENREQNHTSTKAHPHRILYNRVEEEIGIDLRSDPDDEVRKVETENGTEVFEKNGKRFVFNPEDEDDSNDTDNSQGGEDQDSVIVDGFDGDEEKNQTNEDVEKDNGEEDENESEQRTLMKDGEVVL